MKCNDIRTEEVRGEHVIRGKVLNVQWVTLMVHVLLLDYGELLGSSGWEEWSKVCFVTWGIVPVGPQAQCSHLISQLGLSMCIWPKAGYMRFSP